MPQGRIVLKSISQSKKLASLKTDGARLLFTWLLPNVDINGCFSGDPEVIKGQIFTRLKKSTKTILSYIEDLDLAGLIIWYQADGDAFLCIPDFAERQPNLNPDREAKSTIPPPSQEQLQMKSRVNPLKVKESKEKQSKEEVKKRSHEFVPPTEEQINQYCKEKNIYVDATDFIQAYGMKGWMVGRSKMKDWRLAVCRAVKWEINRNRQPKPPPDKAAEWEKEKQLVRDDRESWLRSKSLPALKDLAKDKKAHIYQVCGWLIEEILAEKQKVRS